MNPKTLDIIIKIIIAVIVVLVSTSILKFIIDEFKVF